VKAASVKSLLDISAKRFAPPWPCYLRSSLDVMSCSSRIKLLPKLLKLSFPLISCESSESLNCMGMIPLYFTLQLLSSDCELLLLLHQLLLPKLLLDPETVFQLLDFLLQLIMLLVDLLRVILKSSYILLHFNLQLKSITTLFRSTSSLTLVTFSISLVLSCLIKDICLYTSSTYFSCLMIF
jgi:hypothetical protein